MSRVCYTLLLLVGVVAVAAAQPPKAPPKKADKKDELVLSKDEQGVIDRTNAERNKADLPPLKANPKLMAAARGHGDNMAKQDKLDHVLDDKMPADRVKDAGYTYAAVGENVAWNQKDPAQVLEAWMNSEGHRANILNKEFEEIGVAVARNAKGERYWVQVFGKQLGK
ncbi:CAP domain-containing protein [Gemmata sp.]|uniref:CAP domain-containing protein n=1 Tax=Gemmata sp. TaxID=1914242 RepID=UPI003F6E76C0